MAKWTRYMGIAAIIGVALSVVGVGLVYTTFQEARRTANEARDANKIARSQIRAHLVCEGGEFSIGANSARYRLNVRNVGNSNALDVRLRGKLWVPRNGLKGGVHTHYGDEGTSNYLIPAGQTEAVSISFSSIQTRWGNAVPEQVLIPQDIIDALHNPELPGNCIEVRFGWSDIFGVRQNIFMSLSPDANTFSTDGEGVTRGTLASGHIWSYRDNVKQPIT